MDCVLCCLIFSWIEFGFLFKDSQEEKISSFHHTCCCCHVSYFVLTFLWPSFLIWELHSIFLLFLSCLTTLFSYHWMWLTIWFLIGLCEKTFHFVKPLLNILLLQHFCIIVLNFGPVFTSAFSVRFCLYHARNLVSSWQFDAYLEASLVIVFK